MARTNVNALRKLDDQSSQDLPELPSAREHEVPLKGADAAGTSSRTSKEKRHDQPRD